MTLSPAMLALIDALAAAEVADYMTAQPAPANDPAFNSSERLASDDSAQAA